MPETTRTVYGGGQSWAAAPIPGRSPRISGGPSDLENSPYASVEVELSSAQILALDITPVQLVAAPGTGKVLVLNSILAIQDYGGATYANGAVLIVKYTDASGASASSSLAASVLTTAADRMVRGVGINDTVAVANAALVLTTATAFITGTGVLRCKVTYECHSTGL